MVAKIFSYSNQQQTTRIRLSNQLRWLALFVFGLVIVTLPWRQRILLVERPQPPIYGDFTDFFLSPSDFFLLTLLLLWGISLILQPRRLCTGPFFLWGPIVGLTGMVVAGAVTAVDPTLAAYHAVRFLLLALFYLYILNEARLQHIIWAVAVQLLLQAVTGIAQVWQQHDLGLAPFGERVLDPLIGSAVVWAEGGLTSLRAYGLADHPNILAICLALGMLLLAAWYLSSTSLWRIPALVIFALSGIALLFTFSRPAWMALVLAGLTAVFLRFQTRPQLSLRNWVVLASMSLLVLTPFVWRNLPYLSVGQNTAVINARLQERMNAQAQRQTLNNVANRLFIAHPLTGVGIGTLPIAIRDTTTDFIFDYQPAPVTLLNAAAETGLLGAMFYFMALFSPWVVMRLNRDRLQFTPELIGLSGLLMAITLVNFFDAYAWFYPAGRLWQWLIWGLWAAAYTIVKREKTGD